MVSHLTVIVLPILLYAVFGLVGYAIVEQLAIGFNATRRWLLAPIAGLSVITLSGIFINRLGFPARIFAPPLVTTLVAASLVYLAFRRPRSDWPRIALWTAGLVAALLLLGWPLFVAGTDWLGFENGDMALYLLGANHFYEHGFYQLPGLRELLSETDPSWDLSFYYSLGEVRSAAQLDIAMLMAVAQATAARCYMVLIVACHLVILSTTAAFVCSYKARETSAYVAMLVISCSANLAYGTFNQLMPQDLGIAALAACATVLVDRPLAGTLLYRQAALGGLFAAMLAVAYPEVSPILVLAMIVYALLAVCKRAVPLGRWFLLVGCAAIVTIVCANTSLVGAVHFVLRQGSSYIAATHLNAIFPYYLTPTGFSIGWGFESLAPPDGYSSVQAQAFALAGALLFVVALLMTIREAWQLEPIAVVAAIMLLFLIFLFCKQNGFGLFKLAMYAEPFVVGALIGAFARKPGLALTGASQRA